jgi:hypothetical protein
MFGKIIFFTINIDRFYVIIKKNYNLSVSTEKTILKKVIINSFYIFKRHFRKYQTCLEEIWGNFRSSIKTSNAGEKKKPQKRDFLQFSVGNPHTNHGANDFRFTSSVTSSPRCSTFVFRISVASSVSTSISFNNVGIRVNTSGRGSIHAITGTRNANATGKSRSARISARIPYGSISATGK